MASQREAIIFVHGFYLGRDRNHFIDCLSVGLTEVLEFSPERIQHRETRTPFSLWKQLSGESHDHYFTNEEVLKAVLNL